MLILIATSNPHKIEEIRDTLAALPAPVLAEFVDLKHVRKVIAEPHEDQPTFEGNAALKARYYAAAAWLPCIADDSGLEVDALGGEPGVISARYAGVTGPRSLVDPANNRLMMQRLGDTPTEKRTARFVCAMALCLPGGDPVAIVRGTVEGRILTREEAGADSLGRGANGFVLFDAVAFLNLADELIALAAHRVEFIVGQIAPTLLHLALKLFPLAFDTIPIHSILLRVSCTAKATAKIQFGFFFASESTSERFFGETFCRTCVSRLGTPCTLPTATSFGSTFLP